MRTLVVFFPRLGIQVLRRRRPELAGRPAGLLLAAGEGSLLSAVSVEATASSVEPGMTPDQARQRCPAIAIEPDNTGACFDLLEEFVSIIRSRATTNVAILSRDAICLSLDGLDRHFAGELAAASAMLSLARSWTGLDARSGVADSAGEALCAARSARRFPVIRPASPNTTAAALPAYEPLSVKVRFATPASAEVAAARLTAAIASLQPVMDGYAQDYRTVRLELAFDGQTAPTATAAHSARPLHSAAEVAALVRDRIDPARLEGVTTVRLVLDRPCPLTAVAPWRPAVAALHQRPAPTAPFQRRLLRAS